MLRGLGPILVVRDDTGALMGEPRGQRASDSTTGTGGLAVAIGGRFIQPGLSVKGWLALEAHRTVDRPRRDRRDQAGQWQRLRPASAPFIGGRSEGSD